LTSVKQNYDYDCQGAKMHHCQRNHNLIKIITIKMTTYELSLSADFRKKEGIFYSPNFVTNYIISETVGKYLASAENHFEALQKITILDLSCGAGAFLIESFDFLLQQYQSYFPDNEGVAKFIIENNLFGVDLDEEAVSICKQQLFERSGFYCDNIKCGNSLIDDKAISEKAFEWGKEFPLPMNEGGFTLIVGNPPYVTVNKQNPITALYTWNTDLYLMFFEKCFRDLLRKNIGMLGFITPRYWLVNKVNSDFRNFMLTQVDIWQLTETSPFPEANTECVITLLHNYPPKSDEIQVKEDNKEKMIAVNVIKKSYSLRNGSNEILTFLSKDAIEILIQIEKNSTYLGKIIHSKRGMEIGKNDLRNSQGKATLIGQDVNRYQINFENTFVSESAKDYKRLQNFFNPNLIYLRRVANCLIATMSDVEFAYNKNLYGLQIENPDFDAKYILALLNSKLLDFYYKKKFSMKKVDIFPEIQTYLFEALPIYKATISEQKPFIEKVTQILLLNKELKTLQGKYLKFLEQKFPAIKISKKLTEWYLFSERDLLVELEKQKITIPMKEHYEFYDFFSVEQKNAKSVLLQTQTLENQIDKLVYALYDLSEEEIKIVEM
jgi:adenine-specific DNA-methyltransferase